MRIAQFLVATLVSVTLVGCGNKVSKATSIGDDTYIMTSKARPSPFGVAGAVDMGKLIREASATCTDRGMRFLLLDRQENSGNVVKLGTASVTYKCER